MKCKGKEKTDVLNLVLHLPKSTPVIDMSKVGETNLGGARCVDGAVVAGAGRPSWD